jgi:hypothetical protein
MRDLPHMGDPSRLNRKNAGATIGSNHHMLKFLSTAAATLAVSAACIVLLPPGLRVEAQSAGMFLNAVDLDIVPAERENYILSHAPEGSARRGIRERPRGR